MQPPAGHRSPNALDTVIAGSFSGSLSVLACHPLDVIRTHIQTAPAGTNWMDNIKTSIKNDGIKALYRGIVGPFYAQALYKSVIFTSNKIFNSLLFNGESSSSKTLITGTLSGITNSFVVAPIELVRTSQILYKESFFNAMKLIRTEQGVGAFWKSLFPTIIRDGPGVGLYLFAFDFSKRALTKNFDTSPIQTKLLSGSTAGVAFWLWALPLDTIKTMIEADRKVVAGAKHESTFALFYRTTSQILNGTHSQLPSHITSGGVFDRLGYLYRAWPAAISRGIPAAAVALTTYDLVIEHLTRQ